MRNRNHFDQNGDIRDIFAAVAMIGLMNDKTATPKWVANQAYKYADAMLDVREEVSHNEENNK
jgi:hypothetical protein